MRLLTVVLALVASVAIHAQQPVQFERGAQVRIKPPVSWGDPPAIALDLIVVAVPGDRISADASGVYVNDAAIVGFSPDFVARVASRPERLPGVVPDGHYFLMGEQRINQDITEHWGQHAAVSLRPAQ